LLNLARPPHLQQYLVSGWAFHKTKKMEQIYYWIGLSVFWLSATIGSVIVVGYLLKELLDYLGKKFKILWVMVEFAHYKKEFMEWVKDKKRHPKSQ